MSYLMQTNGKPTNFIEVLQRFTSVVAVGPSALRGQGKDVLGATQDFLAVIVLPLIPKSSQQAYAAWLDNQTELLLNKLPVPNRPWGAARKALNLFMRDALYNKHLNNHFGIDVLEPWLEIPLDSAVAKGLKIHAGRGVLPPWPGLKHLTPEISRQYQACATEQARAQNIARVHLDLYLWMEYRK